MDETLKERLRSEIENAVGRALEAGMSADDVRAEVDYAIEAYEDEEG